MARVGTDTTAGDMESPLLKQSPRNNISVPVYSPYGKEVVQTQKESRCLSGILGEGGCAAGAVPLSGADREVQLVIRSSVWVNFSLFLAKLYAFWISGSLAVLASLVDSAIDLLGQGALLWTNSLAANRENDDYPVGRTRLEPVGVMICAVVMGMASIEVISTSSMRLLRYWGKPLDQVPAVHMTTQTYLVLVGVICLKAGLYMWCKKVSQRHPQQEAVKAIAQDNYNDAISNLAALLAPMLAQQQKALWSVDPLAGIGISVYIIYTWLKTGFEQVEMIVGKRADPAFLLRIQVLAEAHHPQMQLDQLNAYHFGPKYLVELEIVMPEHTSLRESHDAGILLQHKIEEMEEVERCFVHIDYQFRMHDDHDPEVPIEEKLYGGPARHSPRAPATQVSGGGAIDVLG